MDPDDNDHENAIQLVDVTTPLVGTSHTDCVVTMNSQPTHTPDSSALTINNSVDKRLPADSRFSGQTSMTGQGLINKVIQIFVHFELEVISTCSIFS